MLCSPFHYATLLSCLFSTPMLHATLLSMLLSSPRLLSSQSHLHSPLAFPLFYTSFLSSVLHFTSNDPLLSILLPISMISHLHLCILVTTILPDLLYYSKPILLSSIHPPLHNSPCYLSSSILSSTPLFFSISHTTYITTRIN